MEDDSMTAQQMSDKIVERVVGDAKGVGVSVCEVVEACGPDARGDFGLEFRRNLLLWGGVSPLFAEAFSLAFEGERIEVGILPKILVFTEPRWLALPIAKSVRDYARPRWLPVTLLPKGRLGQAVAGRSPARLSPQ
jgi:hypothetical protein